MTPPDSPIEGRDVLIIVNPVAHNRPGRKQRQAADDWLREHGWRPEWVETERQGHATELASRAAERRTPLVLACGGDGTLNEAANGLAGTQTALGMIPAGVTNLWAREVGLLKKPVEAVRLMVEGERRRIDLGRAGDRYFMMVASYGADASVVSKVSPRVKGRLGATAYAISAAREALTYHGSRTTIRIDGNERTLQALMVLCGNTRIYAGVTMVTPDAKADDGLLDVCVYQGAGKLDIVLHGARTLLQLHRKSKKVLYRKVKRIELWPEQPLPLQVDGDYVPDSPNEVEVAPGALWVAVPAGSTSPIFSQPDQAPEASRIRP